MALERREVLKTFTFEQQRQKINSVAKDLYDVSVGDLGLEALKLDGAIIDGNETTGTPGQFLKSTGSGVLWKTLSVSNVLWVTKDGNDTNDGLSQETAKASIGSALRAANSGYLGQLQDAAAQILVNKKLIQQESIGWLLTEYLPAGNSGKQIDAANLILNNKELIANEAVERMLSNNSGFNIPGGNQKCVSDVLKILDTIIFNLKYDGNNKVYEAANIYVTQPQLLTGERQQSVEVYQIAEDLTISMMRNEPVVIQGSHGFTQYFDNSVIGDQSNDPGVYNFSTDCSDIASSITNLYSIILQAIGTEGNPGNLTSVVKTYPERFTFPNSPPESGRYKDSRNLIYKNIDEICDRALAEIAVEYNEVTWGQNWTFPGDAVNDEAQRFKDAYRLIQKNRTYIISEAFDFLSTTYPNFTNPDPDKCWRDIGYYIDALSLDLYLGGNKYSRKFVSFYYSGTSVIYLDGEVTESVATFGAAKDLIVQAIKNLLPYNDPSITVDTNPNGVCSNVEQNINNLHSLIIDVFQNGVSNLEDYPETSGSLLLESELTCRRDISYIVRSVANDLYDGGNSNICRAAKKYFDANGNFIFINDEAIQSQIAFEKAGELMKKAITNQLYEKNLALPESTAEYDGTGAIVTYGVSGNLNTCIDVQSSIDTLILIISTAISDGNLSVLDEFEETNGTWAQFENICLRDIGYIVDAVASDLKNGGNVNCVDAGNSYYRGNSLVFINGEVVQTLAAFEKAKELMVLAMRNWVINAQEDIYIPKFSFIEPYIDESIITEDPIYSSCVDVENSIENYFNIIKYIIQNGINSVEQQLPTFKTTIFVKSGVYTEQNPIILPPNTGIVGDNLREVTIFPANPTTDVFYLNNGSYITGATFSGHLYPSVVGSFPKVKVGNTINLSSSGTKNKNFITVSTSKDLYVGMTVNGNNIGTGAIITKLEGNKILLSVANTQTFQNQIINFENNIGTTGVITRSPYIQNCTSITTTGAGLRVDGNLAGGTASFVLDSYTQYNQGGDGIVIINQGYTQLVSIFEICCDRAVYLSGGSTCSITNSNTDFGNYGLVADGVSSLQYIGKIDGNQQRGSVFNVKNLRTEPYVGQVATFGNNGNPYYFIQEINIINGGEGYTENNPPFVVIDNPTGPDGITAQAIPNISNGQITSITLVSSGSQFIDAPNIEIVGGNPTIQAEAVATLYPQYYSVISSTDLVDGTSTLTFDETVPFNLTDNTEIYFYQVTKIIANSHCFEYVGAGTQINQAIPARGGAPSQENEVVELNGGKVAFTSTDHLGNFRIGQGIQINQNTGTLSGDSFERSLFVTVTPFILALS